MMALGSAGAPPVIRGAALTWSKSLVAVESGPKGQIEWYRGLSLPSHREMEGFFYYFAWRWTPSFKLIIQRMLKIMPGGLCTSGVWSTRDFVESYNVMKDIL